MSVAADKAACCVAVATCGDKDGDGSGTSAFTDSDCGAGFVSNTAASAAKCEGRVCDVSVAADKAACCSKAEDPDETGGLSVGILSVIVVLAFAVVALVAVLSRRRLMNRPSTTDNNQALLTDNNHPAGQYEFEVAIAIPAPEPPPPPPSAPSAPPPPPPTTVEEWLNAVSPGFGDMFLSAFVESGLDTLDLLASGGVTVM